MAANEIHKGDIGTVFEATIMNDNVAIDVSSQVSMDLIFQKADGVVVTYPASFVTDGTDGKVQYTTVADDLDVVGSWKLQAKVALPTGIWSSEIKKFKVYKNLE